MSIYPLPFYFMRHGETDWNRQNLIMGQKDVPLNERGIAQAYQAKKRLAALKIEKIWSSPLQRARQTAEIINEDHFYSIDYIDSLKERGWGAGEGESQGSLFPDMMDKNIKENKLPKDAESYRDFETRVILAFKEILTPNDRPPLVVGHGGFFRILTKLLADSSHSAENCALYFFRPPEQTTHPWFIVNLSDEEA